MCYDFGMKYVSIRELRNRPGRVWSVLSKEDVVLTANGKPMGVLLGVDETRLDDTVAAIRRARAILAVSRMRRRAAETGKDRMSMAEINREIAVVRRRRRPA
jgi:antitoxin (DNA-binding transcriptional repressor) of toxin-antitoxin stability system